MSADDRRELILRVAQERFAWGGYNGTSTQDIARDAGISQPYLFRLFPSKKALFLASCARVFARVEQTFRDASEGLTGKAALTGMGEAYLHLLEDRVVLMHMMQAFAACDDADVQQVTRDRFGHLWSVVQALTGAPVEQVRDFFANGMLLNALAAMQVSAVPDAWAREIHPPTS